MEIQPKDTSPGHFYVSLVKSFIRIFAGVSLIMSWMYPVISAEFIGTAGILFILAECLGILEELV
jgi:hypothetical protein